jgi:outer membrane protein assembly factor BamD
MAFAAVAMALAVSLGGCASTAKDPTANWTPEKLYAEARDEQSAGNFEKAAKMYESLEGRAAGTLLAQQAQIERAYLLYKTGEKAQALSALDRFIKLHPTSPAIDYAMYLQGLVNFNDNLGILGNLSRQDLSERDQQASRDAYQSFKQLVDQYPQSRYTPEARDRMSYIVNSLAAYEVRLAADGGLEWHERGAAGERVHRTEPGTTGMQRFGVGVLSRLPIEWLL